MKKKKSIQAYIKEENDEKEGDDIENDKFEREIVEHVFMNYKGQPQVIKYKKKKKKKKRDKDTKSGEKKKKKKPKKGEQPEGSKAEIEQGEEEKNEPPTENDEGPKLISFGTQKVVDQEKFEKFKENDFSAKSYLKKQLEPIQEIKDILASSSCPEARPFTEQYPIAYQISRDNITNRNRYLNHLPYDRYREIDEHGLENLPVDVYTDDYEGRIEYAREVLECNMRNMIRQKMMQGQNITVEMVQEAENEEDEEDSLESASNYEEYSHIDNDEEQGEQPENNIQP